MFPIPDDNDERMNPQPRFFQFIDRDVWMKVFGEMEKVRSDGQQDNNRLYGALQAVMVEVGYLHTFLDEIFKALDPDSPSNEDILGAIQSLRNLERGPAADLAPVDQPSPLPGLATEIVPLELAVQAVMSRVECIPSQLPVAQFLDLCSELSEEIRGEPRTGPAVRPMESQVKALPEEAQGQAEAQARTII